MNVNTRFFPSAVVNMGWLDCFGGLVGFMGWVTGLGDGAWVDI